MPLEMVVQGADKTARYLEEFGRELPPAIARALNRAIESGRAYTKRELSGAAGLAPKYGGRALSIKRATYSNLIATLTARGRPLPLIAYTGTSGFKSGLGIAGRGYKLGSVPPGSFFAQARGKGGSGGDHRGIFRRVARARLPITQVYGPSVPQLVVSQAIFDRAKVRALEVYGERLDHEVGRLRARA